MDLNLAHDISIFLPWGLIKFLCVIDPRLILEVSLNLDQKKLYNWAFYLSHSSFVAVCIEYE